MLSDLTLSRTFATAWKRRSLIREMCKRELQTQFRGSFMGWAWLVLSPLLLLLVYTVIFSAVFDTAEAATRGGRVAYPLLIFSGMVIFHLFADCMQRAPLLLREHANYLKRVVFPVEILAFVILGAALVRALVSFALLLFVYVLLHGPPPATALLLPLVWLPLCLGFLGAIWLLSAVGLFVRDIHQIIMTFMTVLILISPVFYGAHQLPEAVRPFYMINPIAGYIEATRDVLIWGTAPDPAVLLPHAAFGLLFLWFGHTVFRRLRPQFADVA